jgi:hypothetical protein
MRTAVRVHKNTKSVNKVRPSLDSTNPDREKISSEYRISLPLRRYDGLVYNKPAHRTRKFKFKNSNEPIAWLIPRDVPWDPGGI